MYCDLPDVYWLTCPICKRVFADTINPYLPLVVSHMDIVSVQHCGSVRSFSKTMSVCVAKKNPCDSRQFFARLKQTLSTHKSMQWYFSPQSELSVCLDYVLDHFCGWLLQISSHQCAIAKNECYVHYNNLLVFKPRKDAKVTELRLCQITVFLLTSLLFLNLYTGSK